MKFNWIQKTPRQSAVSHYEAEICVPMLGNLVCWFEEFIDPYSNGHYCIGFVDRGIPEPYDPPFYVNTHWSGAGRAADVFGVYEKWLVNELMRRALVAQHDIPDLIEALKDYQIKNRSAIENDRLIYERLKKQFEGGV